MTKQKIFKALQVINDAPYIFLRKHCKTIGIALVGYALACLTDGWLVLDILDYFDLL